MLLTFVALVVGVAIGRLRGGRWAGVLSTRFRGKTFLLVGITAGLVLNLMTPSQPMFWLMVGFVGIIGFAVSNLAMTGMIVLLIGVLANLAPVLANWAVPVSELALQSVGDVDTAGVAVIDGPRESTDTARTLSFLGDVIPVPLFGKVVSLGDLIALVAVADIAANLMLRARTREHDDAGVTFVSAGETHLDSGESESTDSLDGTGDDQPERRSGPAHAAPGSVRLLPPLPRVKRPAHAVETEDELDIPPPKPGTAPLFGTDDEIDLTDRRPIIDLTTSPSDEQLAEFLRRRDEADRRLAQPPAPRQPHRRPRAWSRRRHERTTADSHS